MTLAPSTLILPLHDPSYSNIHSSPPPSIPSIPSSSPPPSIPSLNSSVPDSPDSPTKPNLIPPDTSVPLRHSTRTKQPSACYNDYEMFSGANHLTSSSSLNTSTRYPLHHYLSYSHFSPTQRAFLALITAQTEPKTYDEAIGDPLWQQAMNDEIAAFGRNHTWSLVPLPPGHKAIGCRWVYKIKHNSDGSIKCYKAQLVAKGYTQVEGVDYKETFSPTAKLSTLR